MKRKIQTFLAAGFFAFASVSLAQVYQWKDPETGVKRFSNTAPSWYRNTHGQNLGPRVLVFYYSNLVDDTGLAFEARMAMRAQSPIGRYLPPLIPPSAQHAKR